MPMKSVRSFYTYLDPDFMASPTTLDGTTLQGAAVRTLSKGGDGLYTYTVLWGADGLDGLDDLDRAVALATSMAIEEQGFAEVRISAPTNFESDEEDEWDSVTVFAIGPERREVEAAAKGDPSPDTSRRKRR